MNIEKLIEELRDWAPNVDRRFDTFTEPADLMREAANKLELLNKLWRQEIAEDW